MVWLGFRNKTKCSYVGPGPTRGMPSVEVLLRDRSPYLHDFRKNSIRLRSDKRDRELNPALPVYKFRVQNRSATGGPSIYWGIIILVKQFFSDKGRSAKLSEIVVNNS